MKELKNEPGKLMGKSRFENVSSISSFIDSMVDWLDSLLLPNTDLQNNIRVHLYKVRTCGDTVYTVNG